MARTPGALLFTAALLIGGTSGWALARLLGSGSPDDVEAEVEFDPSQTSARVALADVEIGDLPSVVAAAGQVRAGPAGDISVTTRATGRVTAVHVVPGQRVERGEVLAELDAALLVAARAEAQARALEARTALEGFDAVDGARMRGELEAAMRRTQSEAELASRAVVRTQGLRADGLASERALAEASQAEETAGSAEQLARRALSAWDSGGEQRARTILEAQVAAAEAALALAQDVLAEASIRAPQAGQIVSVGVNPGTWVDSASVLARLASDDARVVVFGVGLEAARSLAPGARVWWTDAAGAQHSGEVTGIVEEVSSELGLLQVLAKPADGANPGPLGLAVRGQLQTGLFEGATLVPERAVVREGDRRVVMVVGDDAIAHLVPVRLLGIFEGRAAIEGELAAGARVIVEGGYNLPDGSRVEELTALPAGGGTH